MLSLRGPGRKFLLLYPTITRKFRCCFHINFYHGGKSSIQSASRLLCSHLYVAVQSSSVTWETWVITCCKMKNWLVGGVALALYFNLTYIGP